MSHYPKSSPRVSDNHPTQRSSRGQSVDRDQDLENGHSTNPSINQSTNQPLLPRRQRSESPRGKSKAINQSINRFFSNHAYFVSLSINVVLLIIIILSLINQSTNQSCTNPDAINPLSINQPPLTDSLVDMPIPDDRDQEEPIDQPTKQSTNPSINQPIIEPVEQPDLGEEEPINRPPINQPKHEPINPPINQPTEETKNPPAEEPKKSTDQSINQPTEQPKKQADPSPNQSINQSKHKGLSPSLIQPGEGGDRTFFIDDASDHYTIDESTTNQSIDPSRHFVEWDYCLRQSKTLPIVDKSFRETYNLSWRNFPFESCDVKPTSEQFWQVTWYGGQVAVGVTERQFPSPVRCAALPPPEYHWPHKYTALPAIDQSFFYWKNLRVDKFEDLIVFNTGTPKNLYHFEAPRYDLDGLEELALAAQYIPFASKIRTFLDVGAGGASLGLLMRRKYRVETISVIFPDWPYCEYISERGGLCVLVDAMEAMPFARGAFDVIHVSWVYHGQHPHELIEMFMEIDRLVRPGGYIWQRGGFSMQQVETMKHLFKLLGYTALHDKIKRVDREKVKIQFGSEGDIPFEAEWSCIYVKPTSAVKEIGCEDDNVPDYGTVVTMA